MAPGKCQGAGLELEEVTPAEQPSQAFPKFPKLPIRGVHPHEARGTAGSSTLDRKTMFEVP